MKEIRNMRVYALSALLLSLCVAVWLQFWERAPQEAESSGDEGSVSKLVPDKIKTDLTNKLMSGGGPTSPVIRNKNLRNVSAGTERLSADEIDRRFKENIHTLTEFLERSDPPPTASEPIDDHRLSDEQRT